MTRSSDNNGSEAQSGSREADAERSVEQRNGRRNTNRQRGRVRAMSVRENTKSESHRKTHEVEPDATDRRFRHLTRGGLRAERRGEVSRGRSSEEAPRKKGGAKGQRNSKGIAPSLPASGCEALRNARERQLRQLPGAAGGGIAVEPRGQSQRGANPQAGQRKGAEDAR